MINVCSMDNETDLGESLASSQDCSPNSSSSLSKSDMMSGNQILDNWRKFYLLISQQKVTIV